MDPFTILGAVGTCASILAAIARVSANLVSLKSRWSEGAETIEQLARKLSNVQTALSIIKDWAGSSTSGSARQAQDLRDNLQVAVEGCQAIVEVLDSDVAELVGDSAVSRLRQFFLFPRIREHERRLDSQMAGLQLLVNAAYCGNLAEQQTMLRTDQSRKIFQTIRDDTTTIREESTVRDQASTAGGAAATGLAPASSRGPRSSQPALSLKTDGPGLSTSASASPSPPARPRPQPFDARSVVSSPSEANTSSSSLFSRLRSGSSSISSPPPTPTPATPLSHMASRLWTPLTSPKKEQAAASAGTSISKRAVAIPASPRSQHSLRFPGRLAATDIYILSRDNTPPPRVVVAAQRGDVDEMTALVRKRDDINQRHARTGRTPLLVAAHCGHDAVVDLLLAEGAVTDAVDKYHLTALHLAAATGHCRVVNTLLDRGAAINARAYKGRTPLRIACDHGQLDVVRLLGHRKAMIDARDTSQRTPLHAAAEAGDLETARLLLQLGANKEAKDSKMRTPLHVACQAGRPELAALLVGHKAAVESCEEDGMTPLALAARLGRAPVLEVLLAAKASVRARSAGDQTPLHWASFEGHEEVVEMLLRLRTRKAVEIDAVNINGRTPLHLAAMGANFGVIEKLLAAGAAIETACQAGYRPLHYACQHATHDEVSLLLNSGADCRAPARSGETCLHLAVRAGSPRMVRTILAKGAPVDAAAEDSAGITRPLVLACSDGNLEIVQLLLDHGARPRGAAASGSSRFEPLSDAPMCTAAAAGFVQVIQALAASGGAVREVDAAGWQPLRHAAFHGHSEAVACLLGRGARATDLGPLAGLTYSSTAPADQTARVADLLALALESETAERRRVVQLAQTAQTVSGTEYSELPTSDIDGDGGGDAWTTPVSLAYRGNVGGEDDVARQDTPRAYSPSQPGLPTRPAPYSPPPPPLPPPLMTTSHVVSPSDTAGESLGGFVSPLAPSDTPGAYPHQQPMSGVSIISSFQPSMSTAGYDAALHASQPGPLTFGYSGVPRTSGLPSSTLEHSMRHRKLSGLHEPLVGTGPNPAELG